MLLAFVKGRSMQDKNKCRYCVRLDGLGSVHIWSGRGENARWRSVSDEIGSDLERPTSGRQSGPAARSAARYLTCSPRPLWAARSVHRAFELAAAVALSRNPPGSSYLFSRRHFLACVVHKPCGRRSAAHIVQTATMPVPALPLS